MNPASTPQPPPTLGHQRVLDVVLDDIQDRAEAGRKKYGCYLETHNGRDPLWDLYQELLDAVMYIRQELLEREEKRNELHP